MNIEAILYLDTTSSQLMLGVSVAGEMRYQQTASSDSQRYHSAMLTSMIETALKEAKLTMNELTAVAVNVGPGSFTGIRTGLVTVRTLGQFLPIHLYAFNTFELLAAGAVAQPVAIYLDARRGRAYHACLHYDAAKAGFDILQPPILKTLAVPEPVPTNAMVIAPQSLHSYFEAGGSHSIQSSDGQCAPSQMLRLIQDNSDAHRVNWQDVLPLYLEEPNITLPKIKA